ncbi:MAG: SDR family oxidoreductase [Myxococcota bacterium]
MVNQQGERGPAPLDPARVGRRVFVTGASGFIGSHLVRELLDLDFQVTCLVLPHDRAPLLGGLPVERVTGDLSDVDVLARAMDGLQLVFHVAAIYAIWLPDRRPIWEVNVGGTRRMMEAARKAGVRRVVHTSSIAAVGHRPDRALSDETMGFNDWGVADDYVFSKYVAELEALKADGDDLEVVAANPAFPFGPHDIAPTPTGQTVLDILTGRMPFITEGGLNAVDVRDVAHGHLLVAAHGKPGERYILGGHNVTYRELAEAIGRVAGRRPPRLSIPPAVLRRFGQAAEQVADRITHRPPLMTARSAAYTVGRYLWFSIEKARTELGYEPRPLEEAIAASVAWFRDRFGA